MTPPELPTASDVFALKPSVLPRELEKVFRKLERVVGPLSVEAILAIDVGQLEARRGIGRKAIEGAKALQALASNGLSALLRGGPSLDGFVVRERSMVDPERRPPVPDGSELRWASLSDDERKVLRKLEGLGMPIALRDIVALRLEDLEDVPRLGRASIDTLTVLLRNVACELTSDGQDARGRRLVFTRAIQSPGWMELERALIHDFESYLLFLSDVEREVLLSRWGYTVPERTLQEVADGLSKNITRERVRQIESKYRRELLRHLSVPAAVIRSAIEVNLDLDIAEAMPALSALFERPALFYDFLDACCDNNKGTLGALFLAPPKLGRLRGFLDVFFRENISPTDESFLREALEMESGLTNVQASQKIEDLIDEGRLVRLSGGLAPRRLSGKAAVAHVLLSFPAGLPWLDIARIANAHKLTANPLPESRLTGAMHECESAYFSASGCYRHLRYFEFDADVPAVLERIRETIARGGHSSANLAVLHSQLALSRCGYYELRHVVMTMGEQHDLYFDGRSNVDTVSIVPDGERVGLRAAVLRRLRDSEHPLTAFEIAAVFRSRSLPMAQLILGDLVQAGAVVRADRLLYTTPEKAFASVRVEEVGAEMDAILQEDVSRPVHVDLFRERLNLKLNVSYSCHLWLALATSLASKFGWHRRRMLVGTKPIAFDGVHRIAVGLHQAGLDRTQFLAGLSAEIRLSELSAVRAWQLPKRSLSTSESDDELG